VSAAKPSSEEIVARTLASGNELTGAEIATSTGLGRSTVGKALAALERSGMVRRHPGGRDGRRPLPDRWSVGPTAERDAPACEAPSRLRPGQLDGLVLDYISSQGDVAVGATGVAKALGRSAGAVGNCLALLAAGGQVHQGSATGRAATAAPPRHRARAPAPAIAGRGTHEGDRIGVAR
jgi:DNA-binding transcriptional ArsR family regulator